MSTPLELRPAGIRVPASTSNLGAGFDCLGLALDRSLAATFEPGPGTLRLERRGTLETLATPADDDLLVRTFTERIARAGAQATGVLCAESDIPLARGLGSSAAAVVAGLALADEALGREPDRDELLVVAEALEGHPDNVAPAIFGGLVVTARDADGASLPFRLPLSDAIGFAQAFPGRELATSAARKGLPEQVPLPVATRGLGRMAALVQGLATADPKLLSAGFSDDLHVPHRLALIPGGAAALQAAERAGAWAATISGAGSGLIAACPPERADDVAAAMAEAFRHAAGPEGVVHFTARPDTAGLRPLDTAASGVRPLEAEWR
mgnify:FL=1